MKMKLILLALVITGTCVFTSCKSHEKCPAYSKATTVQPGAERNA